MGIAYRRDPTTDVTITVWDGPVSPDDWRKLVAEQNSDPDWPTAHLLGVFETAHGFSSFDDDDVIDEMIATYKGRADTARVQKSALVTQLQLGRAGDIPQALRDFGVRVITFGDLRTAAAWLGADLGTTERIVDELRAEIRARDEEEGRLS